MSLTTATIIIILLFVLAAVGIYFSVRFGLVILKVQDSIEVALNIAEHIPQAQIELHLDISPAHKNNGTSKISDMVTGYAKASGFDCKIKPDAWASQSVADKHSK